MVIRPPSNSVQRVRKIARNENLRAFELLFRRSGNRQIRERVNDAPAVAQAIGDARAVHGQIAPIAEVEPRVQQQAARKHDPEQDSSRAQSFAAAELLSWTEPWPG